MSELTTQKLIESIENINKKIGKIQKLKVKNKNLEEKNVSFKIKSIIGRGTFGVVSLIEINDIKKALKIVYQDGKHCNRELKILQEVNHKNIVELNYFFYSSQTKNGWFLNMIFEYVPICFEDLVKNKFHDILYIKDLYNQAISALKYLHSLKICHRDIKPANILIDTNNILKICDFGCAKHIDPEFDNISYICSRFYRAPENLFGLTKYSFEIDIWALALVFCEFRVSSPFFYGKTTDEMLQLIFKKINNSNNFTISSLYVQNTNEKGFYDFLFLLFNDYYMTNVIFKSLIINPKQRISADLISKMACK